MPNAENHLDANIDQLAWLVIGLLFVAVTLRLEFATEPVAARGAVISN